MLVRVKNAPGSLAAVMTAIAANGGNIFNMKVTERNPLFFEFIVDIEVRDVAHLQNILGALRVNNAVESVDRVREAEGAVHSPPLEEGRNSSASAGVFRGGHCLYPSRNLLVQISTLLKGRVILERV